jgi:predicted amidohydrolase
VVRIGACQTREILGDVDAAVGVIHDFAGQADRAGVDLLLFPECFLQGYRVTEKHVRGQAFEVASPQFAAVLARLSPIRQMLVLGMIERVGGSYCNTALVIVGGRVVGRYRKTFLTGGESVFTAGDAYPVFDHAGVRFGINICYDTRFPQAAAAVAASGAQVLLVPAQNMMRRDKASWWQDRHNETRALRVRETGMWLVSADVTGERDESRIGLGPTCVMTPAGDVVAQVPVGIVGMAITEIDWAEPAEHPRTSRRAECWPTSAPWSPSTLDPERFAADQCVVDLHDGATTTTP